MLSRRRWMDPRDLDGDGPPIFTFRLYIPFLFMPALSALSLSVLFAERVTRTLLQVLPSLHEACSIHDVSPSSSLYPRSPLAYPEVL